MLWKHCKKNVLGIKKCDDWFSERLKTFIIKVHLVNQSKGRNVPLIRLVVWKWAGLLFCLLVVSGLKHFRIRQFKGNKDAFHKKD